MKNKLDTIYIWTDDNLRLQGFHYEAKVKDVCVLFVHGMSGNFIENYFTHILGEILSENGIGFIYGHNRGYSHINDIPTKEIKENGGYKKVRIGAVYERFSECVYDIGGWLEKCRALGYKRFIFFGHSLGCNKSIYYLHRKKQKDITGLILASPPDIVGQLKKPGSQPDYEKLLGEAENNVKAGQARKLLPGKVFDWYTLGSQTFLDLFKEGGPADNLPVLKNPKEFPELSSIDVPILGIMGENDDIEIRTLKEDLDLIASKAINCPSFTKKILKGANHSYERQEKPLSVEVLRWIQGLK